MSENQGEQQPIIVKKIKGGHGGHHGGAWKVAFADFMTAMMAFFLVMWLVGQEDSVKESVAGYFRDPGKYNSMGRSGVLKGSDAPIKMESKTKGMIDNEKGMSSKEKEEATFKLTAKKIMNELEKQRAFQQLKKNVQMQITSEGLRIILNESANSPAFFEQGSDKLLQKSAVILATIAGELGKLSNHLVIEGHTDNSGSNNSEYSNWELSSDRANAARQLMDVSGLYKGQVREVRGFADRFPMIVGSPGDARNRRVTLVVLYEEREAMYDQIEVGGDLMAEIGG